MPIIERRVANSYHDGFLEWNGSTWKHYHPEDFYRAGYRDSDRSKCSTWQLFLNIPIPQGSTINSAKLTFVCYTEYLLTTVRTKIRAAAEDNPSYPTSTNDYLARPLTAAVVLCDDIPGWYAEDVKDSPDFKEVIQEIIDRDGWQEGNAILIFWDDRDDRSDPNTGTCRQPYSWDGDPAKAALLTIDYTPPPTIETQDATGITTDQATLATKVIDDLGKTLSVRHNYGKTTAYGKNTPWQQGKHTNDVITQTVTELEAQTEYHFRGEATFED